MQVVIRADASARMGTGHIARCLTLAIALRERGASVAFVSRMHEGHQSSLVEDRGFDVSRLPLREVEGDADSTDATWAGAQWEVDADETLQAIGRLGEVHWLVVDHYGIDHRWEARVRPSAKRVLVIDDMANRRHDCDLLLDQNLVASMRTRYDALVGESCVLMLGPAYALLQPGFRELRLSVSPRAGAIRRLLISFGGADTDNLTGRALAAFLGLHRPDVRVDVVLGPANQWGPELLEQSAAHANVAIHSSLPTLAPLMAEADLAIGASGTTSWERLCLGLPSIVVTLAPNQRPIAEALGESDLARYLGPAESVTEQSLASALGVLLEHGLSADWSRRCLAVVDGRGVDRVVAALMAHGEMPLRVRAATVDDEALLLDWANDRTTRRNAFSTAPITAEEHHTWFRGRLDDERDCRIFIGEAVDGVPVGQVRFDRHVDAWRISYALAPEFRGRRLGRPLLEVAIRELARMDEPLLLVAEVRGSNVASQRVFDSLGFESVVGDDQDVITYRRQAVIA